jgi:hypothetical protein
VRGRAERVADGTRDARRRRFGEDAALALVRVAAVLLRRAPAAIPEEASSRGVAVLRERGRRRGDEDDERGGEDDAPKTETRHGEGAASEVEVEVEVGSETDAARARESAEAARRAPVECSERPFQVLRAHLSSAPSRDSRLGKVRAEASPLPRGRVGPIARRRANRIE